MAAATTITKQDAEIIGLRALAFIASDDDNLRAFVNESGLDPSHLRRSAPQPTILAGALDFLLAREALFLAFCEEIGTRPERVQRARQFLPGATTEWS